MLTLFSCSQLEEINEISTSASTNKTETLTSNSAIPLVVGYFPSWSETYPSGWGTKLRNMTEEVTQIFLSFIKPNMRYVKGSLDIKNVGIAVPYDGTILK